VSYDPGQDPRHGKSGPDPSYFERRGRMKRFFSFVSKISDLFSRISDIGWFIIILILFIIIFLMAFTGVMKH